MFMFQISYIHCLCPLRLRLFAYSLSFQAAAQCHAVADRDDGEVDSLICQQLRIEVPQRHHLLVRIIWVGDASTKKHVVNQYHSTRSHQSQTLLVVPRGRSLVCIYECQIEGALLCPVHQLLQDISGLSQFLLNLVGDASLVPKLPCNGHCARVSVACHQLPIVRQCPVKTPSSRMRRTPSAATSHPMKAPCSGGTSMRNPTGTSLLVTSLSSAST
mmetsp:Transcript_4540/g.13056  ORF Transcript_4540/g.13056 Transcript_4540/m.13056 type:complete len:216 (+) Transcript_4540:226-873(+)